MRKIVFLIILFLPFFAGAQPSEVALIVTGEGATKEEATNNALRSAIEQAFGVFVSANTTFLNDEIVKEEIATIASGNIKSFKELSYLETDGGLRSITLQAIVAIDKLINYSKSHGSSAEFAGAVFGANMRMKEIKLVNESKVIINQVRLIESLAPELFSVRVSLESPFLSSKISFLFDDKLVGYNNYLDQWYDVDANPSKAYVSLPSTLRIPEKCKEEQCYNLPIILSYYPTDVCRTVFSGLMSTINQLSLTEQEVQEYLSTNIAFVEAKFGFSLSKSNLRPSNSITVTSLERLSYSNKYFRTLDTPIQLANISRALCDAFFNSWKLVLKGTEKQESFYILGNPWPGKPKETYPLHMFGKRIHAIDYVFYHQYDRRGKPLLLSLNDDGKWNLYGPLEGNGPDKMSKLDISEWLLAINDDWNSIDGKEGLIEIENESSRWKKKLKYKVLEDLKFETYAGHRLASDQGCLVLVPTNDYNTNGNIRLLRYKSKESIDFASWIDLYDFSLGYSDRGEWATTQSSLVIARVLSQDYREDPVYELRFLLPIAEQQLYTLTGVEIEKCEEAIKNKDIPGWWLSREGKNTSKKDSLQNDDEAIEFLQKVYPNSIDGSFTGDKLCTDRFAEYSRIECEYDPIYQTQDCYSAAVLPNPTFSKYSKVENAYTVQWQRYEHKEKVTVIVVLKKEEGRWLIDNIVQGDRLLFDYSKPPVSIYVDF